MPALPFSQMSQRLTGPEPDVWAIHTEAVQRRGRGEDVILMSVGDPDFATPEDIIDTLVTSIRSGRTHYSPSAGEMDLRNAITELERDASGRALDVDNFVIFPGATASLYATLACMCDPGDDVIVPEPMYIGYRGFARALGINFVSVPLDLQRDCHLDADAVLAAITPRTRAVLVNTPGNPFGNIVPPATMAALAAALLERQIWLISDEVYSLITFDQPHVSLLKCAADLDNVVVVDGLSKSHAMSGWRIGWVCAPKSLTNALNAYSGAALFGCSQFIQDAAAYALRHNGPHLDAMCEAYRERRDYLLARIEQMTGLSCIRPQAGMFVMLDTHAVANDGAAFAWDLLAQQGVSVVPGMGFGPSAANYVRLSLTHEIDVIGKACDRIAAFVS